MLSLFRRLGKSRSGATLQFQCNICGAQARAPMVNISREIPNCRCGSTLRQRGLVHALSTEMFGTSRAIGDFPDRPDLRGIDMSGARNYAKRLSRKIGYTNTFYHKEPHLDITNPDARLVECYDFVMTSDVLEHVVPPVSVAFDSIFRMLKPGGLLIMTIPYTKTGETQEHFPNLHNYRIEQQGDRRILRNIDANGKEEMFDRLVFHGGEGETLEMRVFSESGVLAELNRAGFIDIHIHKEPHYDFGILWHHDWSLPISARRPASSRADA